MITNTSDIFDDCDDLDGDNIHHPNNNHTIGRRHCNWAQVNSKGIFFKRTEWAPIGGDEWHEEVFKRDNYTCQECGSKKQLHAHHIIPVRCCPWLAVDIDNGITLCKDCHKNIDDVHRKMII